MCVGTGEVEMCEMSTSMEVVATRDIEMVTDDNMGVELEVDKLRRLLVLMHGASQESIALLREQISTIKADTRSEKQAIQGELEKLLRSWDELKAETKNHERELVQRLTVDHELEMNDLRKSLYVKDDEINSLKSEKDQLERAMKDCERKLSDEKKSMETKIRESEQRLVDLEKKIAQQNVERDVAVKEVKERMLSDHRNEIESLRCKFKLMTSMERSPSDTSLEKIERPDIIDITSHEAIINQMKENFDEDMKTAVKNAVERERAAKLSESSGKLSTTPSSPIKSPGKESQEIFRRILEEKDRQLDQMRERENFLLKESMRLKETIQSLTDIELNEAQVSSYREKFEAVHDEKKRLEKDLDQLRERENFLLKETERLKENIQSLADIELNEKLEAALNEKLEVVLNEKKRLEKDLEKEKSKRAKLNALAQGTGGVTINSCSKDDLVLIVWNSAHDQYTVVQDSSVLYFLHAESYNDMKLVTVQPNSYPRVSFCIGKVTDKEYCHAKKDENRYKVSKGTKFYRVKVQPRPSIMERSTTLEKKRSRKSVGKFRRLFSHLFVNFIKFLRFTQRIVKDVED